MTPGGVVTAALLCRILGLLSSAPAAHARRKSACCLSYYRKPLPFHLIKTYTEQHHWENCHLDAIIFETIKNKRVCTTKKDDWVREAVARLRYDITAHFELPAS
uniref:C-C motif chemokine n=1 Tax=Myripristis murdjan TaxID=586833 RepID=A0A668AR46_9TELE